MSGATFGRAEQGSVRVQVTGSSIRFTSPEQEREFHDEPGGACARKLATAASAGIAHLGRLAI